MNSKTLKFILASVGFAIVLGGCETLDPYTQESQTSSATKGAIIGAIAGAAVGLRSEEHTSELQSR